MTNAEGILRLTGLPFTVNNSNINYYQGGAVQFYNTHGSEDTDGGFAFSFTNDTQLGIYRTSINGSTGNEVHFMVQYPV